MPRVTNAGGAGDAGKLGVKMIPRIRLKLAGAASAISARGKAVCHRNCARVAFRIEKPPTNSCVRSTSQSLNQRFAVAAAQKGKRLRAQQTQRLGLDLQHSA